MKLAIKIALIVAGAVIVASATIALFLAYSENTEATGDDPVYNVTPKQKVFIDYGDVETSSLEELLVSLSEKSQTLRATQTLTPDTYKQAFGQLKRLPPDENLEYPQMCGTGLFYPYPELPDLPPVDFMVPLKDVEILATLEGSLAKVDFNMTYLNPSENPIECTYEFPLEAETLVSGLTVYIDGKVIEAIVLEKEEAQQVYEEVVASGDLGVYLDRSKDGQKIMSLKVGNLLPGQEIIVSAQLVQSLQIVNSAYSFILPVSFYPNYRKLGADTEKYPYTFSYSVVIKSESGLSMVGKPPGSILEYEGSGRYATIFCEEADREIQVFYRSRDMDQPHLKYASSDIYPEEVASMVAFTPTFDQSQELRQRFEILEDEKPRQSVIYDPTTLHFIFVLDRSGSMWGQRIIKAKEALILFIRSLPAGCKFSVINYGSTQEYLKVRDGSIVIDYNEENVQDAISQIQQYEADLGGTNIASPMQMAIDMDADASLKKRVILLTDGEITEGEGPEKVIQLAANEKTVVHTLGISLYADRDLLEKTADAGRGTFSLIEDYESGSVMNGKVIAALKKSLEPALEYCSISFGEETRELSTVFRNQLVIETKLMSMREFETLEIRFGCLNDPTTGQPINMVFSADDFSVVDPQDELVMFKYAAYNKKDLTTGESVKYQVLTETTAMVGVVKQERSNGELQQIDTIQFGKGQLSLPEPEYPEEEIMFDIAWARGSSMPMPIIEMAVEDEEWEVEEQGAEASSEPALTASFENLIAEFHSSGYIKDSAVDLLKLFFRDGDMVDDAVKDQLPDNQAKERAYLTLTAIYILQEKYEDRDYEWDLIVTKAKDYLRSVGVQNTSSLLRQFNLTFEN